ncbi:BET1 homolog isoform X1 [Oncorhynchus kisutch]|uniref:BET1 homolog isoform X1 n=1 Tax=Oncorhynchus kisutch TaxID=8019 RepID=UPI0012DF28FD|nr:BET1 homolog isoform X1 [Oncorhynchus kisutch]
MRRAGLGEGGPENYVASGYSAYEEENEHLQEGLRAKVSALKHLSIDIGTEVKYQKNMLDDMEALAFPSLPRVSFPSLCHACTSASEDQDDDNETVRMCLMLEKTPLKSSMCNRE